MLLLPNGSEYQPPKRTVKALDLGAVNATSAIEALVGSASSNADREIYWQTYIRHPWVRACVDLIADAVSSEGFDLQKVDGENAQEFKAEADPRVKSIHAFFRNAFPKSTLRRELFKASIDNNVFGVCYWRKKRAGKITIALERIDPRNLTKDKTLKFYLLRKPGLPITEGERIKLEDIIEIGNGVGDPREGGLSPLESLDMTISTDMSVRKHRNAFFSNAATSGSVLINESGDEDQVQSAVQQLKDGKTGSRNAYKVMVLSGAWKVESLTQAGKQEFDFVKASGISREEVMMVYRVPPGKLFINSGSLGSAGKSEDDATFQQSAVLPLEERIYECLTLGMMRDEWKIDDLELIPRRRATLRLDMFDAAEAMVKFGGTANEARSLVNLQPLADDGMDKALFITSRQPVLQEEIDAQADQALAQIAAKPAPPAPAKAKT